MDRKETIKAVRQLIFKNPPCDAKTLAEILGVSEREIYYSEKEGKIKRLERGVFALTDSCKSFVAHQREVIRRRGDTSLEEERKMKIAVDRKLKELEFAVRQGELITRESVLEEFLKRIAIVRTGLLMLSRSLPGRLKDKDPREMGVIIRKQVMALLDKYSRKGGVLK